MSYHHSVVENEAVLDVHQARFVALSQEMIVQSMVVIDLEVEMLAVVEQGDYQELCASWAIVDSLPVDEMAVVEQMVNLDCSCQMVLEVVHHSVESSDERTILDQNLQTQPFVIVVEGASKVSDSVMMAQNL